MARIAAPLHSETAVRGRAFLGAMMLAACSAAPTPRPILGAAISTPTPTATATSPTPFGSAEADHILFTDDATDATARAACFRDHAEKDRIACLLRVRYRADPDAMKLAIAMHEQSGNIAGLQPERMFD